MQTGCVQPSRRRHQATTSTATTRRTSRSGDTNRPFSGGELSISTASTCNNWYVYGCMHHSLPNQPVMTMIVFYPIIYVTYISRFLSPHTSPPPPHSHSQRKWHRCWGELWVSWRACICIHREVKNHPTSFILYYMIPHIPYVTYPSFTLSIITLITSLINI